MSNSINHQRRNLFRRNNKSAIRPPWSKTDIEFTDICTRCNKCIDNCETHILIRGDGGFPEVDFTIDECSFCQRCVEVCPEPLFNDVSQAPWSITAHINDTCLTHTGVWCQSCKDSCDSQAIKFTAAIGQAPKPMILNDLCTGCGACVSPCPNHSITIKA
ncbi:ferredoxin-type protein NapF [Shewanella sp. Isolate11]|uniref:ferredoxin-type protein NapF n=1 Tax=Shewanella sp. Isolate11 TaxID=2908530 RepID=UPI001EFC9A9E|nr:ferredoxin-type protein NapF [Shewanella sp. Isolate11]MCG9698310.1 ferredoxin-type protein NapF [Shewanella sp. Isolate11]